MPDSDDLSRAEAALVAYLESSIERDAVHARGLIRVLVQHHLRRGLTPEGTVVALKSVIARVEWPEHADSTHRRHSQGELVNWCIDEYFARRRSDTK